MFSACVDEDYPLLTRFCNADDSTHYPRRYRLFRRISVYWVVYYAFVALQRRRSRGKALARDRDSRRDGLFVSMVFRFLAGCDGEHRAREKGQTARYLLQRDECERMRYPRNAFGSFLFI